MISNQNNQGKNISEETQPTEDEQSLLYKIVILPKYLGEVIFNLFNRKDITETSKFILGYMLLAAMILLVLGLIAPDTLKAFFNYFFT